MIRHGCRRVHWGSFNSLGRPLRVIGFIRVRLVNSGVPLVLSESFGLFISLRGASGLVGFNMVHSQAPRVSSGSFTFIGLFLVHSGVPLVLSGSFGFFWITQERSRGRWVHWGSFRSFARAPDVIWLIRVRFVNSGEPFVFRLSAPLGMDWFI